jgi:KDO2-lipid IV(A) lauroyltransferase
VVFYAFLKNLLLTQAQKHMLVPIFRFSRSFLAVLHAAGAALGWVVYWASPSYRRRMRDNMRQAGVASTARGRGRSRQEHVRTALHLVRRPGACRAMPRWKTGSWCRPSWTPAAASCSDAAPGLLRNRRPGDRPAHRADGDVPPAEKAALKPLIEGAARATTLLAPANMSGVRMLAKA